jgi:hypothetical protein
MGYPFPGFGACPRAGEAARTKSDPSRATNVIVAMSFLERMFLSLPRCPILREATHRPENANVGARRQRGRHVIVG